MLCLKSKRVSVSLAVLLLLAFALPAAADDFPNLLQNPGFESGSSGTYVYSGVGGGTSGADYWGAWSSISTNTLTTGLVTSTLSGGGSNMLQVSTTTDNSGIYQLFNGDPISINASTWVFVVSGQVGVGVVGNGGVYWGAFSSGTGWQQLSLSGASGPYTEIIIYATSPGGATFSVDNTSLVDPPLPLIPTPEPASVILLGSGVAALLTRRRKHTS